MLLQLINILDFFLVDAAVIILQVDKTTITHLIY